MRFVRFFGVFLLCAVIRGTALGPPPPAAITMRAEIQATPIGNEPNVSENEQALSKPIARMRSVYVAWIHEALSNRFGFDLEPLENDYPLPSIAMVPERVIHQKYKRWGGAITDDETLEGLFVGLPSGTCFIYVAEEHESPERSIIVHELTHFVLFRYGKNLQFFPGRSERIAQAIAWHYMQHFERLQGAASVSVVN